jgi:hypothetical protein
MTREELIEGLRAIERPPASERERNRLILTLDRAVPHASISDLIFYPDKERSHEEIVDEAFLREQLWATGGDPAVRLRVEGQMRAALADPTLPDNHHTKFSARHLLES